jgi:anti-sigma B factor antagonist
MLTQTEERFDGPLTIERTRYGDDVIVFSLSGEFDLAVAAQAMDALAPALDEPGAMIVVDLTELEFIDSSGVAFFYGLARARPDKDSLRLLRSRHAGVNRVLDLAEVGAVIPIVSP